MDPVYVIIQIEILMELNAAKYYSGELSLI
jgi:hypothetical protein